MRYIETFREKDTIAGIYYCSQKSTALSKSGKEYASLKLQDRTGIVDGKIWNLGSAGIREFDEKDNKVFDGVCCNITFSIDYFSRMQ